MLTSIDRRHSDFTSPFTFSSSLGSFDHSFPSYDSGPASLGLTHANAYQPSFGGYSLGDANPEPPIHMNLLEERSRCRTSLGIQSGRADPSNAKAPRKHSTNAVGPKSSLTDAHPGEGLGQTNRPHAHNAHSRTMSHESIYPARSAPGIAFDSHDEGIMKDTVSPSEYGPFGAFGGSASRGPVGQPASWRSIPSLMPGSHGGLGDDTFLDR